MAGVDMKWKYVKNDDWETPIEYWKLLVPYIKKDKIIYDPFYMNGKAKEKWEELGYKCIHKEEDFFKADPPIEKNIIICSNPPYSKRNKVLQRLIEWEKPFIMLMPITTLCYIKTQRIIKDKIQIIIPNIYKGFINNKGQQTRSPPFYLCYICFKLNLEKDIIYI
tara:strand:+ start:24 stop:518 length:495 start_codon:yes stop_codon:yes gene_type:complete